MKVVDQLGDTVGIRTACEALGVSRATYYRSRRPNPAIPRKPGSQPRALNEEEREVVRATLNSERFMDQSPREVYATLLDENRYLCSIRTMYRILEADNASKERRAQLRHPEYKKPELLATGANQVWSGDITKLLGPEKWSYFYLYVILDIYSRYVVGWVLAHRESSELASRLIRDSVDKQQVSEDQLTIHSDRGPSMASHTVAQLLATLGVIKSHSRPHVSNDNPFSESQFKTMKYRPGFPARFGGFDDALAFCRDFFQWYNESHYHSGIGLLTPASLHHGEADEIVRARQAALDEAYRICPERFVHGRPAPMKIPKAVWINPPSDKEPEEKRPPEILCP